MKKIIGIILILLFSFWSIRSLLSNGYFPMHDDTQVARVVEMGNALKHGQFPVRWVSNLGYGYGYPLFNFYGPLPYYAGGLLNALGLDPVLSTKWMFGIGVLMSPIIMFLCLLPVIGFSGAMVGAIVFLYAPYHAVQVYIRGSVGEYWAIAFFPLIFYGIWTIQKTKRIQGILFGAIGLALVITSHTIIGFLTVCMLGAFICMYLFVRILKKETKDIKGNVVFMIILGLALSSFFWLAAYMEMQYTSVTSMIQQAPTIFHDHYICLSQLWNAPWGYGGSAPGCVDGMSFKIGKIHSILLLFSIVVFMINMKKKQFQTIKSSMEILLICTIGWIFLTLPYSRFLWNTFPFVNFIQYPWRLLSFVIFGIGCSAAFMVSSIRIPLMRYFAMGIVLLLVIGINGKNFVPQYTYLRDVNQFVNEEELRYRVSKVSDEYLPKEINRPKNKSEIVQKSIPDVPNVTIEENRSIETEKLYTIIASKETKIPINIAYFPGWVFKINGKIVQPFIENGLPSVIVSKGRSTLEIVFTNTPIRTMANTISILAIGVVLLLYYYGKKTNA